MNTPEFEAIVNARIKKCKETLIVKAAEYAKGDRLHNFQRAAAMLNCTPERALFGFLAKHLVSIIDIVDGIEKGQFPAEARWDEKVGDAINYLLLLDAVVKRK